MSRCIKSAKYPANSGVRAKPALVKSVDQITTAWLTQVLQASGEITHGVVAGFKQLTTCSNWSTNARLELEYSPNAEGRLPKHLFLKTAETHSGTEDAFDDSELRYYLEDYTNVSNAPLLRCFDAAYDSTHYHLLLEDVSDTHEAAALLTPGLEYGISLAEAVAILHAPHWATQHPTLMPTSTQVQRYIDVAKPGLGHILNDPNCVLEPHWSALLQRFIVKHPQLLLQRLQTREGFTLVHGDLNGFNILVPKSVNGQIYLIDRQPFTWSLTTDLGVSDLAFVMISDWSIAERRKHETAIIRHYWNTLRRLGITGYSWEDTWRDYQLCLAGVVYKAIEFCKNGVDEDTRCRWQSLLRRSIAAMEDAKALEL